MAALFCDLSRRFWSLLLLLICLTKLIRTTTAGKQTSTLKCVDVRNGKSVAWSFCDPKQRPVDMVKDCNTRPCPPRWEVELC